MCKERKCVASAFVCLLSFCLLMSSCSRSESLYSGLDPSYAGSENEIGTYRKIIPGKTYIIAGVAGSDSVDLLTADFEKRYPDVQVIVVPLQIGDFLWSPAKERIRNGKSPDVVFNVDMGAEAEKYQVNLTQSPAAAHYGIPQMEKLLHDGQVYSLPGPSKVMAIAYNKTMFQKAGWSVPQTFDQFLLLCDRIRKETKGTVEPYNPNGKYVLDFIAGIEGFCYNELFGSVEQRAWYEDFLNGRSSFAKNDNSFFITAERMAKHGLIRTEHFGYSYTQRKKEFLEGKIAMINCMADEQISSPGTEFAYFPFPSVDGGKNYLVGRSDFSISVIKRPRTEKQKNAVASFINYISTPGAQMNYIGGQRKLSSIVDMPVSFIGDFGGLSGFIQKGQIFTRVDFTGGTVPESFSVLNSMRDAVEKIVEQKTDAAGAAQSVDEALSYARLNIETAQSKPVASVKKSFTILQTSEYIADKMRQAGNADVALIPHMSIYCGNINSFFSGPLSASMIETYSPRSLTASAHLIVVKMSGSQLIESLSDIPYFNNGTADAVYAFSGLKADVMPFAPVGRKYNNIALANGKGINPDAFYTVATWKGMIKSIYCTAVEYEGNQTFAEFLTEALAKDSVLSPPGHARMRIIWQDEE